MRIVRWWIERIVTSFGTWSKPKEGTVVKTRLGDEIDVRVCAELDEVPKDPNTYVDVSATLYRGSQILAEDVGTIWFNGKKVGCTVLRLRIPKDINAIRYWNYPVGAVRGGKIVKTLWAEYELRIDIGRVAVPKPLKIQPIAPQPQPPPHKETVAL